MKFDRTSFDVIHDDLARLIRAGMDGGNCDDGCTDGGNCENGCTEGGNCGNGCTDGGNCGNGCTGEPMEM